MNQIQGRLPYVLAILSGAVISYLIVAGGAKLSLVLMIVPFALFFLVIVFKQPAYSLYAVIILGFLVSVLSRYIPGIPFGLSIDFLLIVMVIAVVFHKDYVFEATSTTNFVSICLLIWLGFSLLTIVNPLAPSLTAWFYANRGLSFYPWLLALGSYALFTKDRSVQSLLTVWAILSILGTLWGLKQLLFGVTNVEQQWLNSGAASTHVLFGKLRIFSFYSDAAQFGASQAHTGLVFGLIGLFTGKMKGRWIYLIIGVVSMYGWLISGTRGAIAIIAIGGFCYLVMTKNVRVLIVGVLFAAGFFFFLKYTTILQSNYQINRLRTALDQNDPSLQVRRDRELALKDYLRDKPLGGGIGSAGYWGKRFSPGTFLAEIGTDGHYTRLWMETGIIGLTSYLLIMAALIGYLGYRLWGLPNDLNRQKAIALYSGFVGVVFASYTNGLLTQIPTGLLIPVSLIFVLRTSEQEQKKEPDDTTASPDSNQP